MSQRHQSRVVQLEVPQCQTGGFRGHWPRPRGLMGTSAGGTSQSRVAPSRSKTGVRSTRTGYIHVCIYIFIDNIDTFLQVAFEDLLSVARLYFHNL